MLTLHLAGPDRLSIGILDPHPASGLTLFDFGDSRLKTVPPDAIMAVGMAEPAAVSFAPQLRVVRERGKLAANKVRRLPVRRKKAQVPTTFVSGYDRFAAGNAAYWREEGVGPQPLLAAGVFSLSSIQTPIVTALKLFRMLTPYVVDDDLPDVRELRRIVRAAGAGLDSTKTGRPRWYVEYDLYRMSLLAAMDLGLRDDVLRRAVSVETPMPRGLGLAKLSFTLALVGQNLGCLDARIINWAFSKANAERFTKVAGRKRKDGTISPSSYAAYRSAELRILQKDSPFYDADNPVALARSQWMLWESLGPEADRTHTHAELFEAVVEERLSAL